MRPVADPTVAHWTYGEVAYAADGVGYAVTVCGRFAPNAAEGGPDMAPLTYAEARARGEHVCPACRARWERDARDPLAALYGPAE